MHIDVASSTGTPNMEQRSQSTMIRLEKRATCSVNRCLYFWLWRQWSSGGQRGRKTSLKVHMPCLYCKRLITSARYYQRHRCKHSDSWHWLQSYDIIDQDSFFLSATLTTVVYCVHGILYGPRKQSLCDGKFCNLKKIFYHMSKDYMHI